MCYSPKRGLCLLHPVPHLNLNFVVWFHLCPVGIERLNTSVQQVFLAAKEIHGNKVSKQPKPQISHPNLRNYFFVLCQIQSRF